MTPSYITGANGFIGTVLRDRLMRLDHLPIIWIPHKEIRDNVIRRGNLFFLSTYGNLAHHDNNRLMVDSNVEDLIAMTKSFEGWICYMSSSSVTLPVQTPYSRTKRAAEEILQSLPELETCIVRPYSVTGVGEQEQHLIPTLIRSCFEGTEMDFVPNATHDFVDVEDVVDGLIRLADAQATGIHEFGNGIAIENNEVRLIVEEVTGLKANIREVKNVRPYDNEDWCCKNKSRYWRPTKTLRQSITEMVEEYRNAKIS